MAAVLSVFFAVTVKHLDRFSSNLDSLDTASLLMEQSLWFVLNVWHFVYVRVCLAHGLRPHAFTDYHEKLEST